MKPPLINASISFALCAIAIAGYGIWYAAVVAKSAAVAELQGRIDANNEAATRTASARAVLSQIAGDEAAVQSYFVPETGIVSFINDLEARGRFQGASVDVLSVAKDAAGARPELAFSLSVSGTFDAVMRTVGAIEYSPYDLSVVSLSLAHEDKGVWRANIKLRVGSATPATNKP